MQEEIENRTVNLAISTTKLTARGIIRLAAKGLAYIKRKSREAALKNEKPDGRQTIQQLIGQNQGVTNIDISQTDLKGFEKYARQYGVDYAITKDKSVFPPKYLVFFKARDADAMTAASENAIILVATVFFIFSSSFFVFSYLLFILLSVL